MEEQKKILLSLITWKSDWQASIRDFEKNNISEIALFLTGPELEERQRIYSALANSSIKSIPLVHLRHDMKRKECDILIEEFGAKVLNVHPMPQTLEFVKNNQDLSKNIYVENSFTVPPLFFEVLDNCGGICLDITHLEAFGYRQKAEGYDQFEEVLKTTKIGMTHLGAVLEKAYLNDDNPPREVHESHTMHDLSNFDYLKKFRHLFAEYNAIEVNNSIEEQLKIKKYIESVILGEK